MRNYYFFAVLLAVVSCCMDKKHANIRNSNEIEEIRIDTKEGIICRLDSLFSGNVSFVKLETNDDNLIGEVSNIFFDDSLIFVVDAKQTKSVFIFNDKGKYISKIASIGNGPGEYSDIYNVFLFKNDKEIIVVDIPQRKQIHYSYSGEFKSEDRYGFPSYDNIILESGNKAYYIADLKTPNFENKDNHVLLVTNKKDKIIYSVCNEFRSKTFNLNQQSKFWKYNDQSFFNPNFSDTIFLITDKATIPKYHINIIRNKLPHPSQIRDITNDSFIRDYLNFYHYFSGNFIELKDYTYLEVAHTGGYKIIYSHKTKNTYLSVDFANNLYRLFSSPITQYKDNYLVEEIQPTKILRYKKYFYEDIPLMKQRNPDMNIIIKKSFLDSLYHNLNEEDNPVLFFYELNKNL